MPYWDPEQRDELVTIAEYVGVSEAITDRMLLESAGIDVFMTDENVARIAGPFHLAFGANVRLQVLQSQVEEALRILETPMEEPPAPE